MVPFLSIVFGHILDFADNTKIHGPRYISEKSRPVLERLVYLLLTIVVWLRNLFWRSFAVPESYILHYLCLIGVNSDNL